MQGVLFHGEATVGLQADLPLSRRVQLAVLAHIRHTHTRYDKLLKETTWLNARKAVESVCLDVLLKWRSDEETGRDRIEEILREVVVITDSENEDDSSSDDNESSDEEGEISSASSDGAVPAQPTSQTQQQRSNASHLNTSTNNLVAQVSNPNTTTNIPFTPVSARVRSKMPARTPQEKKAHRGFQRYQAAWDEAVHRRNGPTNHIAPARSSIPHDNLSSWQRQTPTALQPHAFANPESSREHRAPDYSSVDHRHQQELSRPVQVSPKCRCTF